MSKNRFISTNSEKRNSLINRHTLEWNFCNLTKCIWTEPQMLAKNLTFGAIFMCKYSHEFKQKIWLYTKKNAKIKI